MSEAKTTTDHAAIRKWVEARQGRPARVRTSGPGGILRIDFGKPEENLEQISWEEFFHIFDDNRLAFLHQERTDGGDISRFSKFIDRDGS